MTDQHEIFPWVAQQWPKDQLYFETDKTVTLRLQEAGVGDVINQIIKLVLYCGFHKLTPKIQLPTSNQRNELATADFLKLLNINTNNLVSTKDVPEADYVSFSNLLSSAHSPIPSKGQIFCRWDHESLLAPLIFRDKKIEQRQIANLKPHPFLYDLVKESELYTKVCEKLQSAKSKKICVHVRRGDVARIPAWTIQPLVKEGFDTDLILHMTGIFKLEEVEDQIRAGNYMRFLPAEDYAHALDELTAQIQEKKEIVFLSDGMTRLARELKRTHSNIFRTADIPLDEIENSLETELKPIIDRCHRSFIGEKHTLLNSMIEGLSSQTIILNSPGFLYWLALLLQLEIEFIFMGKYRKQRKYAAH